MNKLTLKYEALPYPYPEDAIFDEMRWGWIILSVVDEAGNSIKEIVHNQWDVVPLLDWLLENREQICNADLPSELGKYDDISIAESFHRFYTNKGEASDELMDKIYEYRESHDIRFGMRGTDIVNAYIAKNGSSMEVSHFSKEENWNYLVDVGDFFFDIQTIRERLFD